MIGLSDPFCKCEIVWPKRKNEQKNCEHSEKKIVAKKLFGCQGRFDINNFWKNKGESFLISSLSKHTGQFHQNIYELSSCSKFHTPLQKSATHF